METTAAYRTEDQLTLTAGIVWAIELQKNVPRRHSYPLEKENPSTSDSAGDNDDDKDGQLRVRKKSISLQSSPLAAHNGMRLGSKAAQEAAKSFWNMDMLEQSLQKIAKYAAIESSSLGSSIESVDEVHTDDSRPPSAFVSLEEKQDVGLSSVAPHLKYLPLSSTSRSAPTSPTHSPLVSVQRSHSACAGNRSSPTKLKAETASRKLSPYLSPETQKRVHFAMNETLKSPSVPQLTVTGERIHLTPRYNAPRSGSHDDGYHES